jgi:hypothetical protein
LIRKDKKCKKWKWENKIKKIKKSSTWRALLICFQEPSARVSGEGGEWRGWKVGGGERAFA